MSGLPRALAAAAISRRYTLERAPADIVCISHLWWDWVWQRPQHLLSRISEKHRTLYVEEPRIKIGPQSEGFEILEILPRLQVARLSYRSDRQTFWRRLNDVLDQAGAHPFKVSDNIKVAGLMFESPVQSRLEEEVERYVAGWRSGGPLILWLYTPAVVNFIDILKPDLVVYDVMDELAAFKFASPRLKQQEQELLDRADLVFGGGPSLYEGKKDRHPDVHLFPSGVEQEHFAQALEPRFPVPPDMSDLPHPIVGYYGVIDERLDLDLLRRAAEARPEWSFVLVGPVLKIQESDLPRLPNIHYPGKKGYDELPSYLKSFDVAMMPFALNQSTRFISPTKTLEYMAGHKPIVSTPVPDVVSLYGSVVRIAEGTEEFVHQIEATLDEQEPERDARRRKELEFLARYSWDQIASEMHALIENRLSLKLAARR